MKMEFGNYLVKKEKEKFFAVYDTSFTPMKLITHKSNWRQATIIGELLNEAFKSGYREARDLYYEDAWRD